MNCFARGLQIILFLYPILGPAQTYLVEEGQVHFQSDAPLEFIEATSTKLQGALDLSRNTFAFRLPIKSFEGFNSPLQREHFNENYLESQLFPDATFTGKIIEDLDLSKPGEHRVRAKGKFTVHGVSQERIISCRLKQEHGRLFVATTFRILLAEHNISIPRIVYQKIAEEIEIEVSAVFLQ